MDTWSHLSFSNATGGVEPWPQEFLQEKLDAAERAGDEGAVKKIRALCPDLEAIDAEAAATAIATGRRSGATQAQGSRAGRESD